MGIYDSIQSNYYNEFDFTTRRNIQDIVRSYRNFWDPFNELIQNSVDAINRRYRLLNDPSFYLYDEIHQNYPTLSSNPDYQGKILIEVWPSQKKIKISDNGTGIQNDRICKLLCPDSSDKRKGKEYGYKGKGLTFAAFITNHFSILTKYFLATETYRFEVDDLFNWLQDDNATLDFPTTPMSDPEIDQTISLNEYNTSIELILGNDYAGQSDYPWLDDVFSLFDQNNYETFIVLLRSKTAIGNTCSLFNTTPIVPINIDLIVYDQTNNIIFSEAIPYDVYQPIESPLFTGLSYEFNYYVNNLVDPNVRKFACLYFSTTSPIPVGIRKPLKTNFYICMISSINLSALNNSLNFDDQGYSTPSQAGLKPGIYLSIDGMSTGIRIEDWSNRGGALKKYFVIADCELSISDELDAGRKGITDNRAKDISDEAYNLIKNHRAISSIDNTRTIGDPFFSYSKDLVFLGRTPPSETEDFNNRIISAREQINTDQTEQNEVYNYLVSNTSLLHTPQNEEEVRALFHELLAKNIIKGYKTLYAAANRADYDAALDYRLSLNNATVEDGDKIGIPTAVKYIIGRDTQEITLAVASNAMGIYTNDCLCAEFKLTVSDLLREIRDIPTSVKNPDRIDVLIVWDADEKHIKDNFSTCVIKGVLPAKKYLHSVTHQLMISLPEVSSNMYVISLKKIIEVLSGA